MLPIINRKQNASENTSLVNDLRSHLHTFNQLNIGPRNDGLVPSANWTSITRTSLSVGIFWRSDGRLDDFADFPEQRVANDANRVADPDTFALRRQRRDVIAPMRRLWE